MLDLAAQFPHIDAELRQQPLWNGCVRPRAVDLQGAAVHQVQPAAELKLVALGMTAEVIVIIQDQNSGGGASPFAKKMRRGQPADATPHDHEVVRFTGVGCSAGPAAIPQRVRLFERTRVAAAHPRECRRVIISGILRFDGLGRGSPEQRTRQRCGRGDERSLQKITPRNLPVFDRFFHGSSVARFHPTFDSLYDMRDSSALVRSRGY